MLKKLRIASAVVVLLGFVCLFANFANSGWAVKWLSWLPGIQFTESVLALSFAALIWLIITFLLGRVYCSFVCPLGILQDLAARLVPKKRRSFDGKYDDSGCRLRLVILIFYIASLALGINIIFSLLSPYAIFGRLMNDIFNPAAAFINNLLVSWLGESLGLVPVKYASQSLLSTAAALIIGLFALAAALWQKRFWCRKVCPVGTFLGFFAAKSYKVIAIDKEKCIKCGSCARGCKVSCIDVPNFSVNNASCVKCFNCLEACPKKAIGLAARSGRAAAEAEEQ
ncbi:4Fe-4S binding protein [bacterium]|nr:4Fe-4S binding protein [bacterium]